MDKLITVGDFHNRKSLKDMVYQIIRQRILDGQYQPGDQLSIDKLIKELKISRTPVKEAFNQLRTEGLIEIISQRGTYITKLSIKDIRDTFDLRKVLEIYALEDLIKNFDHKEEYILKKWLNEPTHQITPTKPSKKAYDVEFHKHIIRASGNNELIKIYDMLSAKIQLVISYPDQPGEEKIWLREHRDIIESILKRDILKAKKTLITHLDNAYNRIIESKKSKQSQVVVKKNKVVGRMRSSLLRIGLFSLGKR